MLFRCLKALPNRLNHLPLFESSNWFNFKQDKKQINTRRSKNYDDNKLKGGETYWSRIRQAEYRTYFQSKQQQLDEQTLAIIHSLNHQSPDNALIIQKLQNYLKLKQNTSFLAYSSINKINLLTALELRASLHHSELERFRRMLIEHIMRHSTQDIKLDEKSLLVLVKTMQRYRKYQSEKLKWNNMKYLVVHLLYTNFDIIPLGQYPYIVKILHNQIRSSSLDNFRYMYFINLLQQKLNTIFLDVLNQELLSDQYKFLLHHQFITELIQIYDINGLQREEYGHTLFHFLIKKFFAKSYHNPLLTIITNNVIYRFFPSKLVDSNNQNLKLLILNHIIELYKRNQQLSTEIFNSRESQHLCYSIITHFFHSKFLQIPKIYKNGVQYIDKETQITSPELPDFFWELYTAKASFLNNYPIILHTIKNCYPDRYIPTEKNKQQRILEPSMETEMNIRVTDGLKRLNIKFKSEEFIAGRFIDFILQDNILLEIDGVFHYQSRALTPNAPTNFRNLHLILSGYKLMVINIYEYNICRETDQLMELISHKLSILKQKAIFVS